MDKGFLERFLTMLPKKCQNIYDDTIPEAKKIGYAVNDMDNAITEIDYNDPMTFFDIEKVMVKVIGKELKCNSLN